MLELTPHPRLFARPEDFAAINARLDVPSPTAARVRELYRRDLAEASAEVAVPVAETGHNWHLIRARHLQRRLVTLLVEYLRAGDLHCRQLISEYLELPAQWEYWSWIDWRRPAAEPEDLYDLSFGEMGMTLAVVWDWLHHELTDRERDLLSSMAHRQTNAYLRAFAEGTNWWAERLHSNWTAVTNGGAGMLALSMREELGRADEVLQHAEDGMEAFFGSLDDDGGWPEGVGYWNYGMRYGFLYLLSHEAATGQQHPLLAREGVRNTAMFPLVFCPYGRAAGFGDSNSFTVLPFHYRTMERLGLGSYVTMLDEIAALDGGFGDPSWPAAAMYGLLGPTTQVGRTEAPPADKLLAGIEWGYMSDGLPQPKTFMSIRGGSADVPHGHADLMAFWFQVADEEFLVNVGDGRYLDTTFSPVRYELYGCGPLSKNSILLNGVGIRPDSTSRTCSFEHEGRFAIQVDATQCFTGDYQGRPTVERCCRTFVNLGDGRYVIVDRVRFSNEGQFEARFHTFLPLDIDGDRQVVTITGERATVRLRFACNEPVAMRAGLSTPILPQRPADTILQVQSEALVRGLTLVTLIEPAAGDEALAISEEQAVLTVKLAEEVLLAVLLDGNGDPFGGASMD